MHQILPGVSIGYIYREVEIMDHDKKHQGIEVTTNQWNTGKTTVNADDWNLLSISP